MGGVRGGGVREVMSSKEGRRLRWQELEVEGVRDGRRLRGRS